MNQLKRLLFCTALVMAGISADAQWKVVKEELVFAEPPFKECHASTIVEIPTGELLLACFGGTRESNKDVSIWLAKLGNQANTQQVMVADGVVNDSARYASWNPVLFKVKYGPLFLFYKVGPNPREWWGMYKTSNNDGKTWSAAKKLPAGILGPIKNKPIQLKNGTILSPSSVEEKNGRWKAHIEKSVDLGKTWTIIPLDTTEFDVIQPSILFYKGKNLQVLCRSEQGHVIQARSTDNGTTWSKLSRTTLLNPNSGIDAVTLKDGRQIIVYNPNAPEKDWSKGRTKLRVACSNDGEIWKDIVVLENGVKEEYSYPAVIQTTDGLIHITYTFDRKNIKHVVLMAGK